MCVGAERSFSEVNGAETPFVFSSFILDEIGHISYSTFHFCGQIPVVGTYLSQYITFQDLCEDG